MSVLSFVSIKLIYRDIFFLQDGKSGRSALHHAVEAGNLSMINCLLHECHADPDVMTFDEITPLHIAAGRGMESVAALLLAAGADPRMTNYEGESPIDVATTAQVITKEALNFARLSQFSVR